MTEYGETCSSIHMASITDEDECKDVAKNYGLMFLGRERDYLMYLLFLLDVTFT